MAVFTALSFLVAQVSAVLTAVGLSSAAAGIAANLLIGTGLSYLGALVRGKQKFRTPTPETQAVINEAVGERRRGYGRAKLGGRRAFWDSGDGILWQIVMHHHGEIAAFEQAWIGDQPVEIGSDGFVTTEPYPGYVQIETHRGTEGQAASPLMMSGWPGVWTAKHRLRGIAYSVVWMWGPKAEKYSAIFPEGPHTPFRQTARLSPVHDPRTGITAWSDNLSLCIRDYLLSPDGYRLMKDGTVADPPALDDASFIAFADVCDEMVQTVGGVERRYRCWGTYGLQDDPKDVLARMRACGDVDLYQTADGRIGIRGGAWVPPTVTITDRDILGYSLEEGAGRFAAFNELKVIYVDEAQDFQPTEAESWVDEADQAIRGRIVDEFTVDMCPSAGQAARLARIHAARRNPRWRGTIRTNLVGLNARYQRTIRVVIGEIDLDETFIVESHGFSADLSGCEMQIASIGPEAYEPVEGAGAPPPPLQDTKPNLTLPVPTGLTPAVEVREITVSTIAAVIVATVDAPTRANLELGAQFRLQPDGPWQAMAIADDEAVSGVVADGATYDVRARWVTAKGSAGEWSAAVPILISTA